MKLNVRIQNFGKVRDASIAIRPFTVITGYNGSGKSFITRGLYSILHTLNQDLILQYILRQLDQMAFYASALEKRIPRIAQADIELLDDLTASLGQMRQQISNQLDFAQLLHSEETLLAFEPFVQNVQDKLNALRARLNVGRGTKFKAVEEMYTRLSAVLDRLHKGLSQWSIIYVQSLTMELTRAFQGNFQLTDLTHLIASDAAENGGESLFTFDAPTGGSVKLLSNGRLKFDLPNHLIGQAHELKNVVYLESPVYFKMRNALKDNRIYVGLRSRAAISPVPKYFYDLDGLLSVNLLDVPDKFKDIAQKIEAIIQGHLVMMPNGDIMYREQGKNPVSLNMTSSGVANLGMIALLLQRNVLNDGSFLFIDEPEINLHTVWQHIMLDILLDLSRAGVNVVIATHSLDMMHRLEAHVAKMSEDEASEWVSVNHLTEDGVSVPNGESVLSEIYKVKQILGKPYVDLMRERLP